LTILAVALSLAAMTGCGGSASTPAVKHLDYSDRKAVAHYFWEHGIHGLSVELHVFREDSDGRRRKPRNAYEAELIRSRKPKLNTQT
jgi:hypothetical protein